MTDRSKYSHLKIAVLKGNYKYVQFSEPKSFWHAVAALEKSPDANPIAIFRTSAEHSMIIPESVTIQGDKEATEWRCLRIIGDMPFGTVQGLIAAISGDLAKHGLGMCVCSTYLTDLFYIRAKNLASVTAALIEGGWTVDTET